MSTAPHSDAGGDGRAGQQPPPQPTAGTPFFHDSIRAAVRTLFGLVIIGGCFLLGDLAKRRFGLILPGSILGLFLLLGLLGTKIVRLEWVESAGKLMLFLLPAFFVPIYVAGTGDRALWHEWGWIMAGVLTFSVIVLWVFTGRLAQWLLTKPSRKDPA
jgi:holin-like protein